MKAGSLGGRILFVAGVVAFIIGTLDPLEGSVVIAAGSALIAFVTSWVRDRHRKVFVTAFALIVTGVSSLFYFSSLGGFPPVPYGWSLLILPYPVGWLMIVVALIVRRLKKAEREAAD